MLDWTRRGVKVEGAAGGLEVGVGRPPRPPPPRPDGRFGQTKICCEWAALLLGTVAAGVLKWGLGFAAWLEVPAALQELAPMTFGVGLLQLRHRFWPRSFSRLW